MKSVPKHMPQPVHGVNKKVGPPPWPIHPLLDQSPINFQNFESHCVLPPHIHFWRVLSKISKIVLEQGLKGYMNIFFWGDGFAFFLFTPCAIKLPCQYLTWSCWKIYFSLPFISTLEMLNKTFRHSKKIKGISLFWSRDFCTILKIPQLISYIDFN